MILRFSILAAAALAAATPAAAQEVAVIAVPPLATPADKPTPAGSTLSLAWQATQLIAQDLRSTSDLLALPTDQKDFYSYPEVTAPTFSRWRAKGAKAVLTGFIQARDDGRLTVGCYVYDVEKGRELGRTGFIAAPEDWRRAAHKCSGLAYKSLTGSPGTFDTRIAYVAGTGFGAAQVRRIAIMDSDGNNHTFLTDGGPTIMTPRLSPAGNRLAYVTFDGGQPNVRIIDIASKQQRALLPGVAAATFSPRFSPDGNRIAFAMANGGNTDIYVVGSNRGIPQRLTTSPGVDTDPSFSPDGSKILFESDRSGSQQLYVMNADGSGQRRVSFGGAAYAAPQWSPDGEWLAFTRRAADGLRIGIIRADGRDERILTSGSRDEGGNWAASSRELIFQRTEPSGVSGIYRVNIGGGVPRKVLIPQEGFDPDWSGARD